MASDPTRFVIIGNGAAGTYAAEQLRKDDAAAEIVMIDDEKYTLYNRVSLPRYLRGVLLEQRVQVRDMEWHVKNRIDLRLETRVTQVNFEERTVAIEPGSELRYDRLLIAMHLSAVRGRVSLGEKPLAARIWFGGEFGVQRVAMRADDTGEFHGFLPEREGDLWVGGLCETVRDARRQNEGS